jgi:hypothetical protein
VEVVKRSINRPDGDINLEMLLKIVKKKRSRKRGSIGDKQLQ